MNKTRELIILPKVNQAQLEKFLPQLEEEGIKTVYLDPKKIGNKKLKSIGVKLKYPSYKEGLNSIFNQLD